MNCNLWVEAPAMTADIIVNLQAVSSYEWTLPALTVMPSYCTPTLAVLTLTEATSKDISFMTLDFATLIVTMVPIDPTSLGSYVVWLTASLSCPTYNNDSTFVTTKVGSVMQLPLPTVFAANVIVCKYNLLMGLTLSQNAVYLIEYPSINTATFVADYRYEGFSCGTPETDYFVTTIPADPSFTFMTIDTLSPHNVLLDSVNYTGLPGVFKFTLQASGIIDPLLTNTNCLFTVEMRCILSILPQVLANIDPFDVF